MIDYKDHPVFDKYDYVVGHDPGTMAGLSIFDRFGLRSAGFTQAVDSSHPIEARTIGMAYALMDQVARELGWSCRADKFSNLAPWEIVLFVIENNVIYGTERAGAALTQREFIAVTAAYAHKQGYDVVRVSPKEAKKALTGLGNAKKPQVVEAATDVCKETMDGLSSVAKKQAVADSMGIALAGMDKYINSLES